MRQEWCGREARAHGRAFSFASALRNRGNDSGDGVDGVMGGGDDSLALQALAAIIADAALRERFLALTGFDADTIRARAGEPDMAEAVRDFLGGHEPDLLAVAKTLGVAPERLAGAVG